MHESAADQSAAGGILAVGVPFVPDSGAVREREDGWSALAENRRAEELNFSVYDLSEREASASDHTTSVVNAAGSAGGV